MGLVLSGLDRQEHREGAVRESAQKRGCSCVGHREGGAGHLGSRLSGVKLLLQASPFSLVRI